MSCFLSEDARIQKRINDDIEKQIVKDKKTMKKELKLLLLGKRNGASQRWLFLQKRLFVLFFHS